MAVSQDAKEAAGPEARRGDLPKTDSADLGEGALGEAYSRYLQSVEQGQTTVRQRYEEATQHYQEALHAIGQDGQQRYLAALRQLEQTLLDVQRQAAAMQPEVGSAGKAAGQSGQAESLQEIQQRYSEAYQTFSDALASLQQELPRRGQDALGAYMAALEGLAAEAQQRGQEASCCYLAAVKNFWSGVDIDAAVAALYGPGR